MNALNERLCLPSCSLLLSVLLSSLDLCAYATHVCRMLAPTSFVVSCAKPPTNILFVLVGVRSLRAERRSCFSWMHAKQDVYACMCVHAHAWLCYCRLPVLWRGMLACMQPNLHTILQETERGLNRVGGADLCHFSSGNGSLDVDYLALDREVLVC